MEICCTFWIWNITDWWRQQDKTHSKYANLSNVAGNILSIIPHGVRVAASISLGRDVVGSRQSQTTSETHHEKVVLRMFVQAIKGIFAGCQPGSDTTNTEHDSEMKKVIEETILDRMAKVHDILEMWQGNQNLHATQKESHAKNMHMTAVRYISDPEWIVKASWSLLQHHGAAALTLSERSPLPTALSTKDLSGGQTQIFNVCQICRINRHPVESDEDSAPERILDTENWLTWNGDLDNSNDSEDDYSADTESDVVQNICIQDPECPEQQNMSATRNVPGLVRPSWKSKRRADRVLVTAIAIETRRNKGVKKT